MFVSARSTYSFSKIVHDKYASIFQKWPGFRTSESHQKPDINELKSELKSELNLSDIDEQNAKTVVNREFEKLGIFLTERIQYLPNFVES